MALTESNMLPLGTTAPSFELPDVVDGQSKSYSQLRGAKATVVMFICNHCPYVKRITEDLAAMTTEMMNADIGVVAIMSNDYLAYPADAPEKMIDFAQSSGFQFPYLIDEAQSVAKAYGAVCTPDFFGFSNTNGLQYRGNIDGLLPAMREIAKTGKCSSDQTPSMGCSIKWRA